MAFYGWNEGADWKLTKFMKVLFIIKNELGRPGMADMNYFMLKVAEEGLDVGVVCKSEGNEGDHRARGIKIYHSSANGLQWFNHVRESIEQFNPDIVHVSIHLGCGIYPLLVGKSKPKFILDIRSPLLRTGLLRWGIVLKNQIEILGYHRILGHSIASAQTVIGQWHKNIDWAPPGVDLSMFKCSREVKKQRGECLRFVYIGSLHAIRKVDCMLKAFIQSANQVSFVLDIYGVGDAIEDLKAMVKKAKLDHQIRFLGLLPRETLFQRLESYDYGVSYVPKSLFDAAPPLKTMEYLASGIPVLATDTTGNRLFIDEDVNGILAKEDVPSFAQAIQLSDMKVKSFYDRQAIQDSVAQYDWQTVVKDNLIKTYKGLLHE